MLQDAVDDGNVMVEGDDAHHAWTDDAAQRVNLLCLARYFPARQMTRAITFEPDSARRTLLYLARKRSVLKLHETGRRLGGLEDKTIGKAVQRF